MINKVTLKKYIDEWKDKDNKITRIGVENGEEYLKGEISEEEFFENVVGDSCPILKGFNQICMNDAYDKMCLDCWIKFLS